GKHGDSLHRKRRVRCARENFMARRLPSGVARLAGGCGSAVGVGLENTLLAQRRLLLHIELKDSGIPPCDQTPSGTPLVQAGLDRTPGRRNPLRATVDYAVVAELRAPRRDTGRAFGVVERMENRVEHIKPTSDWFVSDDGHDKEVAGASCRHKDDPYCFRAV